MQIVQQQQQLFVLVAVVVVVQLLQLFVQIVQHCNAKILPKGLDKINKRPNTQEHCINEANKSKQYTKDYSSLVPCFIY